MSYLECDLCTHCHQYFCFGDCQVNDQMKVIREEEL